MKTMKKDEVSLINCDSSYAFGERGREDWEIKPSMSVEYEIHLKSFEQVHNSFHNCIKCSHVLQNRFKKGIDLDRPQF